MKMPRVLFLVIGPALVVSNCADSEEGPTVPESQFVSHQRILYSDGLHSENTEMIKLDSRILLAFRGGEEGQTGSAKARIKIYESTDSGYASGYVEVLPSPVDTIQLAGSTFGATRITGATLPDPVSSCD